MYIGVCVCVCDNKTELRGNIVQFNCFRNEFSQKPMTSCSIHMYGFCVFCSCKHYPSQQEHLYMNCRLAKRRHRHTNRCRKYILYRRDTCVSSDKSTTDKTLIHTHNERTKEWRASERVNEQSIYLRLALSRSLSMYTLQIFE